MATIEGNARIVSYAATQSGRGGLLLFQGRDFFKGGVVRTQDSKSVVKGN